MKSVSARIDGVSEEQVPPVVREVLVDEDAVTIDPALPAFLAPPEDAPAYHGFPVVAESEVDGWRLGMITGFGVEGDGYVIAPDDGRAGLVWTAEGAGYFRAGHPQFCDEVCGPDEYTWGVFSVGVRLPLRGPGDARAYLAALVPQLRPFWAARTARPLEAGQLDPASDPRPNGLQAGKQP
ncbi:hypothetical protein ACQEVZ_04480 [Dactylosporangium sp. CA-152071]|uniref:hypothetical protein n=1 Tax=Dactylosporangium sp. CA-152071 TaxID=3239933 RepID=UPI003D89D2B8